MAALLNPVAPAPLPIRLIGRMVDWTVVAIGGAVHRGADLRDL